MGPQDPFALEVSDLSHSFGTNVVLDKVNLAIEPSRFCVLLGLNGAGKTTLFSLITRLYNNRGGSIRIFGHDVAKQPVQALQRLGVVFQQRTLDLDLTVSQNLSYHGALHGLSFSEIKRRAQMELQRAGLVDRARDKARSLSGGQVRRLEIARALLHRPRLLLLDEPTVGLDIESRQSILDHVRMLCREQKLAVLWATHLIDEVVEEAQVIILHKGRILADGRREDVVAESGTGTIRDAFTALTQKYGTQTLARTEK